jgi:hypothetical protein
MPGTPRASRSDGLLRGRTFSRRLSHRLSPTDGGTRLTVEAEIAFKGLARLAAPLARLDVGHAQLRGCARRLSRPRRGPEHCRPRPRRAPGPGGCRTRPRPARIWRPPRLRGRAPLRPPVAGPSLELVADLPVELLAGLHVLVGLDPERWTAVDHGEDGAPLLGLGEDDLQWVRGA